jgi:phosphoadenosine phosphosulfate reductase
MADDALITEQEERIRTRLDAYADAGMSMFVSSSFQTHSLPLLHLIGRFRPEVPVYFLNTGFHFPETMAFRHEVADRFGLKVIDVSSPVTKLGQRDAQGRFFFVSDPDRCCYLNKVLPMEPIVARHDVWINGVRRDQTKFRAALQEEEMMGDGKRRYHPMLDWTSRMIWAYRKMHDLPEHPLEAKGYVSIGCLPCTRSVNDGLDGRGGRWAGQKKEECGIQTAFVGKGKDG